MDGFSNYGINLNNFSDVDLDLLADVKRWFSYYFGEDFANRAESAVLKGGSIAKKRERHDSSASIRRFHSHLSPIITRSHIVSFYDDPRDKIPSDLRDREGSAQAEHCCERCQLMTGTVEGLRALMSAEGHEHYTCDEVRQQSAANGCPFCDLVRWIMGQCKTCSQSAMGEGIIRVRGLAEGDDAADGIPFRPSRRLEALKVEIPMDPDRNSSHDSHHGHELGLLAYQGKVVSK